MKTTPHLQAKNILESSQVPKDNMSAQKKDKRGREDSDCERSQILSWIF